MEKVNPPRFKRLPKCNFRATYHKVWSRVFSAEDTKSICGNTDLIKECLLRERVGPIYFCALSDKKCFINPSCACCFWCKLSKKERLGIEG